MQVKRKILNLTKACKTVSGKHNELTIVFEDGTTTLIRLPNTFIVVGQGAYDYGYMIYCSWDFTKEQYCPILFSSMKWGFINKWFEIVSTEIYDSVGIIHVGHGCHTPPYANEFSWDNGTCWVYKNDCSFKLYKYSLQCHDRQDEENEYIKRFASIDNLSMDVLLEISRKYIPLKYQKKTYNHPELNHGLDLLKSEEGLDCYMAAYGEMHQAKCKAAMQNMPFPPKDSTNISLSLEIIDWGCGQGIGTICLVDYLKERELTQWLKKITLIEPSEASLNRAIANVTKATCNRVRIIPLNEYLPSVLDDSEANNIHYEQNYVFHIFSNILDVTNIDLAKLAKSIAVPGHIHYILCMGPLNANAFRIDRFCEIFTPTEFFSNISNGNYGQTSDTNYRYTCKTKAFVYNGGSLNLSKYDPTERATEPVYNEYNLNLQISNGLISKEKGQIYSILRSILSSNDLLYLDPELNGASPDFIIVRPNVGVVVISIFEENLLKCHLDDEDQTNKTIIIYDNSEQSETKRIQSPFVALENYQNLIIENLKEFTEAVIEDNKNLSLVKKVLICTKGSITQAKKIFGNHKYITIYGNEFINNKSIQCRIFDDLRFNYINKAFDNVALNQLIKDLSPKWHSYREGIPVHLTKQQISLSTSIEGSQRKISGVAGSGKTQVLATRAVNAQLRSGGEVLLLTFNITLVNYMRMRLSQVRADFPWDKIDVDYYHRFFRKYAIANNFHVYMNSYNDADFFEKASNLKKYDAIFIDEVQDYLTSWLQLLRKYFLKENGEFVVFGDPKQNIYIIECLISIEIFGWNSFRVNGITN